MPFWRRFPLPAIALAVLLGLSAELGAQSKEEYAAPGRPYGLTYDGANFWYSDPSARKVVRISDSGRPQGFYLGNRKIYGIQFNPDDGHVYVGSERKLLKVHPISGQIAGQIPVKVDRVAGLALGPDLWYLLEKGSGVVHFFDPRLQRTISSFETGVREARDVFLNGNALWVTDGKNGAIHRFDLQNRKMTGIVQGPVAQMRGISFNRSQLWIINRKKQIIQRLPFLESEQYIASGETRYRLLVKINMTLPPNMRAGNVVILQPPNSPHQRVTALRAKDRKWKDFNFLGSGQRVFAQPISAATPRTLNFEYQCTVTARNVRYLIGSGQVFAQEELNQSPGRFFFRGGNGAYNGGNPLEKLKGIYQKTISAGQDPAAGQDQLRRELDGNLPAQWNAMYRAAGDGFTGPNYDTSTYLRGYGWIPLSVPAVDRTDMRRFARAMEFIELYRQPDANARGRSVAFHVNQAQVSGARNMTAVPAKVTVELSGL